MTRFPTPAHLASWARFAPGVKESAGRKKGTGSTGHGDRYLARSWARPPSDEQDQHVPGRTLPAHRPPPWQEEGRRRGRSFHPGHRLVPAARRERPVQRPRPRLLRLSNQPRTLEAQPHSRARSPRLPRHPAACRLTHPSIDLTATNPVPAPLRSAGTLSHARSLFIFELVTQSSPILERPASLVGEPKLVGPPPEHVKWIKQENTGCGSYRTYRR